MKAITILAFLIVGGGLLAWGFTALTACLLPIELPSTDEGEGSRIFPSSEGILLSTADALYRRSLSGKFDPVAALGSGKCTRVADVFDTQAGVFVITAISGDCKSELYRFTAKRGLELVLAAEEREKFVQLEQTGDDVFVILTDAILKLEAGKNAPQSLPKVDQCTNRDIEYGTTAYKKTESFIFFPTANGSLCKLGKSGLNLISGWTNDFLLGAAEAKTNRAVFLWGPSGAYWLDENNHVEEIKGIPGNPVILGFYEASRDHAVGSVFVLTTNGLFVYSPERVLTPVLGLDPSDVPNVIHSVHEIEGRFYTLASNGVFRLSEEGKLERRGKAIGVKQAGYNTAKGVFFISSDEVTYRLSDSGEPALVALQTNGDANVGKSEKPSDIKDTKMGLLLATDRALYHFREANIWDLVPSGDLGLDIRIIPIPEGVITDVPVFVKAWNGVFEWIESPFDVKSLKEAWNYIVIFWWKVVLILLGLLVILFVFGHYSLYSYRWVCYYILGLVAPSRVHNQIFINYRSDDTGGYALALYNELCLRFARKLIFFDLAEGKIDFGAVLPARIRAAVEQCTVLLALIGSHWLDAQKADGSRRLDDPNDYVRQEIALALEREKKVIPVLVGNVSMPMDGSLPEPLKPLSRHLAMRLGVGEGTPRIEAGVDQLSRQLVTFPNIPPVKRSLKRYLKRILST